MRFLLLLILFSCGKKENQDVGMDCFKPQKIEGLSFYDPEDGYQKRIPRGYENIVPEYLHQQSLTPSGGRLSYLTNSTKIKIKSLYGNYSIYINGEEKVEYAEKDTTYDINTGDSYNYVTVYMSTSQLNTIEEVCFNSASSYSEIQEVKDEKPIVWYGSSITQGLFLKKNPGWSYPAIIDRELRSGFYNFGFSGSGKGEMFAADIITSVDSDLYILDFWANPTIEEFRERFIPFVLKVKELKPNAKIIIMTPYTVGGFEEEHEEKYDITMSIGNMNLENVYIYDQMNLQPTMANGRHPDKYGSKEIADNIIDFIKQIKE